MQTVVAEALGMARGDLKSNTNRERLEAVEYKVQQESIKLQQLQQQNADLEQKKNEVRARIEELDRTGAKEALSDTISELVYNPSVETDRIFLADENDLIRAISVLEDEIHGIEKQIASPGTK
jgi:prefoldin subunit 5